MKTCDKHWALYKSVVDELGMTPLISTNSEEVADKSVAMINGGELKDNFDPLMELDMHFANNALGQGGIYLLGNNEDGSNDGHYCAMCEIEKHVKDFDAEECVRHNAGAMATWAREQGLLPPLS